MAGVIGCACRPDGRRQARGSWLSCSLSGRGLCGNPAGMNVSLVYIQLQQSHIQHRAAPCAAARLQADAQVCDWS